MSELKGLRDDVYRRPLATALERLGLGAGWRCVDVGAGGGDVSVALAEMVGPGRPRLRGRQRPAGPRRSGPRRGRPRQVIALTQAGEDLVLPEQVDLAFCRFLLLHVLDPAVVVRTHGRPWSSRGLGGGARADHLGRPHRRPPLVHARRPHPDIGALLPALVRDAGLEVDRRLGRGPGRRGPGARWRDYLGIADRRRSRATTPSCCPRW